MGIRTSWSGYKSQESPQTYRNKKTLLHGKAVTDNGDITELMHQYFCEIGTKLRSKIPNKGNDFIKYLPPAVVNSFILIPLCEDDVTREIKNMNPRKATGHDGISIKVLQLCHDIFAFNLTNQWYENKLCFVSNENKPVSPNFTEIATKVMTIQRVCSDKYLGVVLDEKLRWNEHVESVCQTLTKYLWYI